MGLLTPTENRAINAKAGVRPTPICPSGHAAAPQFAVRCSLVGRFRTIGVAARNDLHRLGALESGDRRLAREPDSNLARLDCARRALSIATAGFKTFLRTRLRSRFPNRIRVSFGMTISLPPEAQPRSLNAQLHNRYSSRSNRLVTRIRHSSRIRSFPLSLSLTKLRWRDCPFRARDWCFSWRRSKTVPSGAR